MVTGFTHYKGFRAAQHNNFTVVFQKFLDEQKFGLIIEIGTLNGGLTMFLKDASPNSRLVSYDVKPQPEHPALIEAGVELKIKNIFSGDYSVIDQEAIDILSFPVKKLILCDGGHKAAEFNSLSAYIKSGDFIMAHDYSHDYRIYESKIRNKVWNWCELTEQDISGAVSRFSLVDYNKEEFQSIVWVCKTKN